MHDVSLPGLRRLAQQEGDPVTRGILERATQAWCRGDFPVVWEELSRLAEERVRELAPYMEDWQREPPG